jgi:hypothetical protein
MSIVLIAMTGILAGFLFMVVGFLMGDSKRRPNLEVTAGKRVRAIRKRVILPKRKAA